MRIANGRVCGDLGKFTCITNNGKSVIDYCSVSKKILPLFNSFNTHCIIELSLLCNTTD